MLLIFCYFNSRVCSKIWAKIVMIYKKFSRDIYKKFQMVPKRGYDGFQKGSNRFRIDSKGPKRAKKVPKGPKKVPETSQKVSKKVPISMIQPKNLF